MTLMETHRLETPTPLPWTLHVVPASHFDLGWCLNTEGSLAIGSAIIREAVDLIDGPHPDFRCTIEYVDFLKHFLETHPDYKPAVKRLLDEGKLEVCATSVGAMEQIFDGELLVRELAHGMWWLRENLDYVPLCAQHTDLPGHTIQIAQILAKCEIPYLSYSRYRPPTPLHIWESPDGSRVVAANHYYHYNWGFMFRWKPEIAEERLLPNLQDNFRTVWPDQNVLMPEEHDLKRLDAGILENMRIWNERHADVAVAKCATLIDFFRTIDSTRLPVYKGEMPYGFYSIPAYEPHTYKEGRHAENALASAEKFASIREILGLGAVPRKRIEEGWAALFWPHDHNIAGQDGPENDGAREHQSRHARFLGEGVLREVKATMLAYGNPNRELGKGVLVFNSQSWKRSEVVQTRMELPGTDCESIEVVDPSGKAVPAQILDFERAEDGRVDYQLDDPEKAQIQVRVAFLAKDVPATGYKTFYIRRGPATSPGALKIGVYSMENDYFVLRFGQGLPVAIADRVRQRSIAETEEQPFAQIVALEDLRGDLEDGYDFFDKQPSAPNFTGRKWTALMDAGSAEILEAGPVRAKLRFSGEICASPLTQTWTLYRDVARIDLDVSIDWQGERSRQVRMLLPFELEEPRITYETPFGSVIHGRDEMPNTYRGDGVRWVQKWFDLADEEYGVTVGSGCCAVNFNENIAAPVLLSTTYCRGDAYYWMENRGVHNFRFTFATHNGDWVQAGAHRLGWEHWNPLDVARVDARLYGMPGWETLPEMAEYIAVDDARIIVTAFKPAHSGEGYVLRVFNVSDEWVAAPIRTRFNILEARSAWLTEKPRDTMQHQRNLLPVTIGPHAVETYLLKVQNERIG